jgi:hypothetical protein
MEWRSSCEVDIREFGDRLEVFARTQAGALSGIVWILVVPSVMYMFAKASRVMGLLAAALVVFGLWKSRRNGNETRLIIRPDGFIAEGNINRTFAQQVTVSVNDMHRIGYFVGYEGDPSGLYAFSRWGQTCLMPGIDEPSCLRIQAAIEAKFPEMRFGQEPISLLGNGPELISLGLSRNKPAGGSSSRSPFRES